MSAKIDLAKRVRGKRVLFMATCLCDAFFDDVAKASVEVLEHLGCEVVFLENQTCCGQPAFNGGDWLASRKVVRHMVDVFKGEDPIVTPSGSCAAMLFHGAPLAFENEKDLPAVESTAKRSWEIIDFIVNGLGITQWQGGFNAKIALHQACHTRGTPSTAAIKQLFSSINGLELLPYGEPDQCCGFGGTFSVAFPHISSAMGQLKIDNLLSSKPDYVVSSDMSCLMHQKGLAEKRDIPFPMLHAIQILRDSLN